MPSTMSCVSAAAALAEIHADQLFEIFTSVSLSAGRPGDAMLLGKSQPPSAAALASAASESWLLGMASEEAALYFHLYPKA